MSSIKAFGSVAIMIACFAIVYPRFMHPFVLRALGLYEAPKKDANDNMYPPNLRSMHPGNIRPQPSSDDLHKHTRSVPHPGMRAAAEMQKQQTQQGSGRGMMGMVLPFYAIGIVLYLIYTLFKVFNKPSKNSYDESSSQYDGSLERRRNSLGFLDEQDDVGDDDNIFNNRLQRRELEDLLTRVDNKNVSLEEMRVLQKRLEDTEAQMTKILAAMQTAQANVEEMNATSDIQEPKTGSSADVEDLELVGKGRNEEGDEMNEGESAEKTGFEMMNSKSQQVMSKAGDKMAEADIVEDNEELADEDNEELADEDNEELADEDNEELVDEDNETETDDDSSEVVLSHVRHRKGRHDSEH